LSQECKLSYNDPLNVIEQCSALSEIHRYWCRQLYLVLGKSYEHGREAGKEEEERQQRKRENGEVDDEEEEEEEADGKPK
jgi:hypothetical protein